MSSKLSSDRLMPSDKDMISLTAAVMEGIRTVSDMYKRQWRIEISTIRITRDLERMNTLVERYQKKDYRHTDSEKKAVRTLAQWSMDQKSALVGQPTKKLEWKD